MSFNNTKVLLLVAIIMTAAVSCENINLEKGKLVPRQREGTRSWINIFQSGFIEGSLRYSSHGKLDCTQEGMKLTRAFVSIIMNRIRTEEHVDQDVEKNAFMLFSDIFKKCNYVSSVEGAIASYLVRKTIIDHIGVGVGKWICYGIITVEMLVNFFDDLIGYQLTYMALKQHKDFYNTGVLIGRLSKTLVAFYMQGWHETFINMENYI